MSQERLHKTDASSVKAAPPIVRDVLASPGQPLDAQMRAFMEPRFGYDFSGVRVHTDAHAAQSARAVSAHAYTVGNHVAFAGGQYAPESTAGRVLLAHELVHVVQQNGAASSAASLSGPLQIAPPDHPLETEARRASHQAASGNVPARLAPSFSHASTPQLHRYETSEHATFGKTGDLIAETLKSRGKTHTVAKGDTPASVALKFGISVDTLKKANPTAFKPFLAKNGKGVVIKFHVGEVLTIPPILNEAHEKALAAGGEMTFQSGGVDVSYGQGVAMGDFFGSAEDMAAKPAETGGLVTQIKTGKDLDAAGWNKLTGGRYSDLALTNHSHFGPSDASLAAVSGASPTNHKLEWEKYHRKALEAAQKGDLNAALAFNSFGDHFLTDAFAAGHLTNKADVMAQFKNAIPLAAKKDFWGKPTGNFELTDKKGIAFFDAVAKAAFIGAVKTEFSKLVVVKLLPLMYHVNDPGTFSSVLQGIYEKKPDMVANLAAGVAHDTLNTQKGGVSVENNKGEKWQLTGDGTLNKDNTEIILRAVAQSQMNVLDSFKQTTPLDFPALFKAVWDFTPRPTAAGKKDISAAVSGASNIASPTLATEAAKKITENLSLLIDKLIAEKALQRDPKMP